MSDKEVSFLDEFAGQGFENITAQDTTTPMLLISQALSDVVQNDKIKVGHFYNSVTGEDYGTTIKVIVCHFDKVWNEWKPNQGGFVGRHAVGSIAVTGDVYSGMKYNGNDVIETFMYLVVLPEHPEAGYLVFSSTRGNLKYLKAWNTQMWNLRTPSGKPAPIFAAVWEMSLGKDTNKQGNTYYSCSSAGKSTIKQVDWIPKETYTTTVLPAREIAGKALALADNRIEQEALPDNTGF